MSDVAAETAVPHDMDGLRQLYFTEFCPLYNYLCSKLGSIPSELHFEVSAAFDHLMRAGLEVDGRKYEAENIAKASGHLKRATFDAFKLLYKYTMRPLWKKLTRSRYETVPGFVEDVQRKWIEATTVVERARGRALNHARDCEAGAEGWHSCAEGRRKVFWSHARAGQETPGVDGVRGA